MKLIQLIEKFAGNLPWLGLAVLTVWVLGFSSFALVRLLNWLQLGKRQMVCIELTPTYLGDSTDMATDRLFAMLYRLRNSRSRKHKLLRREVVLALEVVATRQAGIKYTMHVEANRSQEIQQVILTCLPGVKVTELKGYHKQDLAHGLLLEFKQTKHYAFPLGIRQLHTEQNPIAFMTRALTKLSDDEFVALQFIVSPVVIKDITNLLSLRHHNDALLISLRQKPTSIWPKILDIMSGLSLGFLDLIGTVGETSSSYSSSISKHRAYETRKVSKLPKPSYLLSSYEQLQITAIQSKLTQPLFRVSIRAAMTAESQDGLKVRKAELLQSLRSYSIPPYQSLKLKSPVPFTRNYRKYLYTHRLPPISRDAETILYAPEIASLYHLPIGDLPKPITI